MIKEMQIICDRIKEDSVTTKALLNELEFTKLEMDEKWTNILDWASKLGLIESEKFTKITDIGRVFFSMSTDPDSLNDEQKMLIFEKCILGNKKKKFVTLGLFFDAFQHDGDFVYKLFDSEIDDHGIVMPDDETWRLLDDLDVVPHDPDKDCWYVTRMFSKSFSNHKLRKKIPRKGRTQEKFEEDEKEKIRIGQIGEDLAFRWERQQLLEKGWNLRVDDFDELNSKENIIAKKDLGAGYDLSSYRTEGSQQVDKFIEVKSRKYKEKSFVISEKEILVGKEKSKIKKSYFIYFYYNLGKFEDKTSSKPTKIIPFEDLKISLCDKCPNLYNPHYLVDISEFF